jgi:hypothetical protein
MDLQVTVTLKQCFMNGKANVITVAEVSSNGECGTCSHKKTQVQAGSPFYQFTLPEGKCTKSLCVYVHDKKFSRYGKAAPKPPGYCIDREEQRCKLCSYEKITVRNASDDTACPLSAHLAFDDMARFGELSRSVRYGRDA